MIQMSAAEVASRVKRHSDWLSSTGAEGEQLILPGANLSNIDLSGARLNDAVLVDANLTGARLAHADLSSANLTAANLSAADLSHTRLVKADLDRIKGYRMLLGGANLMRTSFINADLREVIFDGALLRGTGLGGDLRGASFRDCQFDRAGFIRALLGQTAAEGATGTIFIDDSVVIETPTGEHRPASADDLEKWWSAAGGTVKVNPPAR